MRQTIRLIAVLMLAVFMAGCAMTVPPTPRHLITIKGPCVGKMDCTFWGECTPRKGMCFATPSADCRKSEACLQYGRCVLKEGNCAM